MKPMTNVQNLPDALVRAVQADSYSKGDADYSVTGLLKPPRQAALEALHADELVEDAADRVYSLYGQIAHLILERANIKDLAEKRYFAKFGDKVVSGQIDSLDLTEGILTDWKFVTAYKFKFDTELRRYVPTDADYTAQLNMQLEILRRNGLDAQRLQIGGLLRDWSKLEARRTADYPQKGVIMCQIEMWSREQTVAFINERIALHEMAKKDPESVFCSVSERYNRTQIWAVMRGERSITGGNCKTEKAAQELLAKTPGARIEFRPGVNTKCEAYCNAAPYCNQFKKLKGEQ